MPGHVPKGFRGQGSLVDGDPAQGEGRSCCSRSWRSGSCFHVTTVQGRFFSLVARGGKVGAFLSLFCPTHWVRLISFWSSSFLVITENNPVNHKSLESETLQKSPFGDASHFPTIIIINHSKQCNCQEKIFYRG